MLSIILPCYNEPNIEEMIATIKRYYPAGEIIVSEDPHGRGKGWALRQGLERASGEIFIFMDSDMDIHPRMIVKLLPFIGEYDIVVGKKQLPRTLKRKIVTFLSRIYIRLMFGIGVDTQTGLKVFNYKPTWKADSWACDIEILHKAKKLKKKIKEVSILARVSDSKTLKDILLTFIDSIKIRMGL